MLGAEFRPGVGGRQWTVRTRLVRGLVGTVHDPVPSSVSFIYSFIYLSDTGTEQRERPSHWGIPRHPPCLEPGAHTGAQSPELSPRPLGAAGAGGGVGAVPGAEPGLSDGGRGHRDPGLHTAPPLPALSQEGAAGN